MYHIQQRRQKTNIKYADCHIEQNKPYQRHLLLPLKNNENIFYGLFQIGSMLIAIPSMFLFQIEIPRDIEPEINIPFPPGACRLRQELGWNNTLRIGEHQLEYVPAGLDVPAQRKGIVDRI